MYSHEYTTVQWNFSTQVFISRAKNKLDLNHPKQWADAVRLRAGAREKQESLEDRARGEVRDPQDRDAALPDAAAARGAPHAQRQLQCHGHLQGTPDDQSID